MTTRDYITIGIGLAGLYIAWKGTQVVKSTIAEDLNPASDKNIIYRGVNALGQAVTGDDSWALGTSLYSDPPEKFPEPDIDDELYYEMWAHDMPNYRFGTLSGL